MKTKRTLGSKLLMLALFLGVLLYFGVQAVRYLDDPLATTLAYPYQVELGIDLSGFVVRQERVLEDNSGGLLRIQRAEGERVGAGGVVAAVYADQASLDRQSEIDTLESRIEQLEYAQALALEAETHQKLDSQIAQSILDYRRYLSSDRLYDAETEGAQLRALVTKRDYSGAEGSDIAAQIQELEEQLKVLRNQAAGSVRRITAPMAGLYSGEVDGYENVLTPESLEDMTPSWLAAVTPADASDDRAGKLVLGTSWYYAAALSVDDAEFLREQAVSGTLILRFAKGIDQDLPVVLECIGPQENGRVVVVLRGDTYLQELTLLRQQRAQVLYGAAEGIRVPKEAIRAERASSSAGEDGTRATEDATGVYCVVGLTARFKPVRILYSGDDFVLVQSTAESDSLLLRVGEEIIVTARGLYDGKILE